MSDTLAEPLTPEVLESYDRLRADCGLIAPRDIGIVEIRGEDRKGWLQGQATNDLKQLDSGASSAFCLCSATGQIVAVCDIWGLRDRFILTCERSTIGAVMERFDRMVILEDVEAADVTDQYKMLSIQGPNATRALQDLVALPTLDSSDTTVDEEPVIALRSNRTGLGGWDILVPTSDTKTAAVVGKGFVSILGEAYEIARLEAGFPSAGHDWDARTLPPELGPAFEARHVSYKKGCYTGQEILMRIHTRGHTNRTWMALHTETGVEAGCNVSNVQRKDIGFVTSACYSPDYGYIAGAMLRNESAVELDTVYVATASGLVPAEVRHMPILRMG